MTNKTKLFHWARILAAIILLQTLYYKFWAHPESIEIFMQLDMEPVGRIGTGIVELIAWILLLLWGTRIRVGALIWVVLMIGAIYFHITVLGYDMLFGMAGVTLLCCLYVIRYQRIAMKQE